MCGRNLFYDKNSRFYKAYELAHIYPLNPTAEEVAELEGEERLSADVNHPDNIIPLCGRCHGQFDKPRTADEYQRLAATKRQLILRQEQQSLHVDYQIEDDIQNIIEGLYSSEVSLGGQDGSYDPKSLKRKLDESMPVPTQRKIKHNVADYYQIIRSRFLQMEREKPTASELIAQQVKVFYLKQKSLGLSQQEVFSNIVKWLQEKTKPKTVEAAEIVTSFFIQNCEVFE